VPLADDKVKTPENYVKLRESTDKPVFAFTRMSHNCDAALREFQDGAGMPFLFSIPTMVRSLQALVKYAAAQRRGLALPPAPTSNLSNLTDDALAEQLGGRGVTMPAQSFAADPQSAAAAAEKIGFPVALKIISDDISHKTEAGGVRLGLADGAAVLREAEDLQRSLAGSRLSGFLVQEMVDGLEMLVGVREDTDFGPLVVVGLGGVFVELFRDVSLRLAPVDENEVRAMLSELRGAKALDGFRGQAPRDVDALVKAIIGVCNFFLENRSWLAEIEVNPLIVLAEGEGVRAVDVRPIRRD